MNEDFEKIITTYKDFFNLVQNNKNADDFYIKTHKDEFTKINAVCEKEINQMYLITLEDGHSINCADEHCLMDKRGNMILVKDLVPNKRVMTLNGPVSIKSIKKTNDKIAYDISIEYPHWYVNDNYGLIHHNTLFSLVAAKAYLDFYPDAVLLFFDSEFGSTKNYFEQIGIPTDRVLHTPITNIEEFKFDIVAQLEHLKKGDHVFIIIDSIGNLASKKEVEDAANQKSVADMTRAKSLKSLFRIITPILILKDLTAIPINHVYQDTCLERSTKIKTIQGLTPISKIKKGDYVYTNTGTKKVIGTFGPSELSSEGKKYLELEFDDGSKVKCTSDHTFLIENETWARADELSIGSLMY